MDGGWVKKNREQNKVFRNQTYCQLYLENECHVSVCSLFQVLKHISTGLYVYELPYTCL